MSDAAPTRMTVKDMITLGCAVIAASAVIGGVIRADGGRTEKQDANERRIVVLEEANQAKTDLLTKIDGRTIRIETKLEMMTPAAKLASR